MKLPKPILSSFEVEQNGASLRIIDVDGSVYQGSLQADGADLALKEAITSTGSEQELKRKAAAQSPSKTEDAAGNSAIEQKRVGALKIANRAANQQNIAF